MSSQQLKPGPGPSTGTHGSASMPRVAGAGPEWNRQLSAALSSIGRADDRNLITPTTAEELRRRLDPCHKSALTPKELNEIIRIAERLKDPQYIEKAFKWGGLTLLRQAPTPEKLAERNDFIGPRPSGKPAEQVACRLVSRFNNPDVAGWIEKWSGLASRTLGVRVDPNRIAAMHGKETSYGHDPLDSHQGARGLLQVLDGTRREIEQKFAAVMRLARSEGEKQIAVGVLYYAELLKWTESLKKGEGGVRPPQHLSAQDLATMGYNMGDTNLLRWLKGKLDLPEETRKYLEFVRRTLNRNG